MSTLLDAPLSEREEAGDATPPPPPPPRRALLWILALLVPLALGVGWAAGYLWPRTSPPVLSLSTSMADFGELRGGEESSAVVVEVDNSGGADLDIESVEILGNHIDDFRVTRDDCTEHPVPGSTSCVVELRFTPPVADEATPVGERRTANLRLRSNASNGPVSLPLVGVRVTPRLEALPTSVDFGQRPVTAPAEVVAVTVTNRGSATVRVQRASLDGEGASDFLLVSDGCSSASLEPGDTCRVRLTSTPRRPGPTEATLRIASDAGSEPLRVPLTAATGFAEPVFELSAESLDFGDVRAGADVPPKTVEIRNLGDEPLTVRRVRVEPAAAGFTVSAGACVDRPVPIGGACEMTVVRTASAQGVGDAEIVLVYTRPGQDEDGERRISLTGRTVAPRLTVAPDRLDLGTVPSGTAGPFRSVRMENRGTAPVTVREIALDGSGADAFGLDASCAGRTLGPGEGCELRVRFRPVREGAEEARLRLRPADGDGSALTVSLRGEGVVGRPRAAPERLGFPAVAATRRADRTLTVTNVGRAPLRVGDVRIEGRSEGDFRVVGNACGRGALEPDASCELTVRFAPGSDGGRERSAVLRLEHDGAGSTPGELTVPLSGSALPEPKPELAVAPASLPFGDVPVGQRSGIETVTVRNPGTARLSLEGVRLDGPDAADFRLVAATCDGMSFLAPGGDCTVGVRFLPTAAGDRRARIVVSADVPERSRAVELSGRGLTP